MSEGVLFWRSVPWILGFAFPLEYRKRKLEHRRYDRRKVSLEIVSRIVFEVADLDFLEDLCTKGEDLEGELVLIAPIRNL